MESQISQHHLVQLFFSAVISDSLLIAQVPTDAKVCVWTLDSPLPTCLSSFAQ